MSVSSDHRGPRHSRVGVAAVCAACVLGATVAFVHSSASSSPSFLASLFAGFNTNSGYIYSLQTDCFAEGQACPAGSWCNVISRDNWYPRDVSYLSRGRCVAYAQEGDACEEATTEPGARFPVRASGQYFVRPTLCDPSLTCTGDSIEVLPPTCVQRRLPADGCMSTKEHGCAGRPSSEECPTSEFCRTPTRPFDQTKLEQCASIFASFNGPSFSFGMNTAIAPGGSVNRTDLPPQEWQGLPNDANIEPEETGAVRKNVGMSGPNPLLANELLRTLWPYPICDEGFEAGCQPGEVRLVDGSCARCTAFPLRFVKRDSDGGLLPKDGLCQAGNHTSCVDADFLLKPDGSPKDGLGAVDYHCSWGVMHQLSMNGPPFVTPPEASAFRRLIAYVQTYFDCKVCRSNFAMLVSEFGTPEGYDRAAYGAWFSLAHNNANEHTYATHSPNVTDLPALRETFGERFGDLADQLITTRMDHWANPNYMHAWFMEFGDAYELWHDARLDNLRGRVVRSAGG